MTEPHSIAWTMVLLVPTVGCEIQPNKTPLHEVSTTLEKVAQSPLQTQTLCESIEPTEAKNECVLMGVEKLNSKEVSTGIALCSSLTEKAKGECWFRLGERHDSADFCAKATPFDFDCRMHLLSRWLFRHPKTDWAEMVKQATKYGVDPVSKEGETVLYRHIMSIEQPMRLDTCAGLPNRLSCERAATSIYRDRLRFVENQGTFPCRVDDDHPLSPANQPSLHLIYIEFHHANCSN